MHWYFFAENRSVAIYLRSSKLYSWKILGGRINSDTGSYYGKCRLRSSLQTLHFTSLNHVCIHHSGQATWEMLFSWWGKWLCDQCSWCCNLGCEVHKSGSPFLASKVLLFHAMHHSLYFLASKVFCSAASLHCCLFQKKFWWPWPFSYSNWSVWWIVSTNHLPIEVDFKYSFRVVFYFSSWYFRYKKMHVLIQSKIPGMGQSDFPKWHFFKDILDYFGVFFLVFICIGINSFLWFGDFSCKFTGCS